MPTATRDPRPRIPTSVPLEQAELLGTRNRVDYRVFRGKEYRLAQKPGDPSELGKRPGEQWFSQRVTQDDDGYVFEEIRNYLGTEVPVGEFAALVAQDEARRAKAAERDRPRLVNAFRRYPLLTKQRDVAINFGGGQGDLLPLTTLANNDDLTVLMNARLQRPPSAWYHAGRGPAETWAQAIDVLSRYVTLDANSGSGQLRRFWRSGRIVPEVALILDRHEVGFRSVVTGRPLMCLLTPGCRRPADRDADPNIAWCGACDGHELRLEAEEGAA